MSTTSPFNANIRSTISVLTTSLRDIGRDLPGTLTTEFAAIDAATSIPEAMFPDTQRAARRWYDVARQGQDPAKDKDVVNLLGRNRDNVGGLEGHLATLAEQAKADALVDAADEIVNALHEVVAEAQETLDEARTKIGPVITDSRASGLSPENARQYARAKDAFARVGIARRSWIQIANLTHRATWRPGRVEELLIISDLNLDALTQIEQRVRQARTRGGVTSAANYSYDARVVLEFGHQLDMPDFDGFLERQDRIAEETKRLNDASQQRPKVTDGIDASRLRSVRA